MLRIKFFSLIYFNNKSRVTSALIYYAIFILFFSTILGCSTFDESTKIEIDNKLEKKIVKKKASGDDYLVAIIDTEPVLKSELIRFATLRGLNLSEETEAVILDQLVSEKLLVLDAKSQNITADDPDIERYLKELQSKTNSNIQQLESQLNLKGVTLSQYREDIRGQILRSKLVSGRLKSKFLESGNEKEEVSDLHLVQFSSNNLSVDEFKSIRKSYLEKKDNPNIDKIKFLDLGIVEIKDLRDEFKKVVKNLNAGDVSEIVTLKDQSYFFQFKRGIQEGTKVSQREFGEKIKNYIEKDLKRKFFVDVKI